MKEFYVGYVPRASPVVARFIRRVVAVLGCISLAICVIVLAGQTLNAPKTFEYGIVRSWEGTIFSSPYPALAPRDGGAPYLLVAPGKHGYDAAALNGKAVHLSGTLIQFGENRMLQVASVVAMPDQAPSRQFPEENLGPATLEGEIVDTKCFFGVMQPGSGKVHRACAARCIAGGIPPGLLIRESNGQLRVVLLAASNGTPLRVELKRRIAEPVRFTGALVRTRAGLVLRTNL
jgi:hypothetical protein